MIHQYLFGNDSAAQQIGILTDDIARTFQKQFPKDTDKQIAGYLAKTLEGLDFAGQIQSIVHTAIGLGITLIILLCFACLLYRYSLKPMATNIETIWTKFLQKDLKRGNCGNNVQTPET